MNDSNYLSITNKNIDIHIGLAKNPSGNPTFVYACSLVYSIFIIARGAVRITRRLSMHIQYLTTTTKGTPHAHFEVLRCASVLSMYAKRQASVCMCIPAYNSLPQNHTKSTNNVCLHCVSVCMCARVWRTPPVYAPISG